MKSNRYKLNLQVFGGIVLLLALTLGAMAYISHRELRGEAMRDAELTLEGTVQDIDNILLSVEQSAGNMCYDLLNYVDDSSRVYTYCREMVKSNPNVVGCAIAYKPGYFPGKDLFMVYVHRRGFSTDAKSDLVTTDKFTNRPYTEQVWYTEPMKTGYVGWTNPLKGEDTENEALVTFCLPFYNKQGERVGLIGVDVSISMLSKIVLSTKPTQNGYCVLLARNGSFIVHPDADKLSLPMAFSQMEAGYGTSTLEALESMIAGETGVKFFTRDDRNWCVFYKPFKRAEVEGRAAGEGTLGWSVGVVYPDDDIFGMHNILLYLVFVIAIVGVLLFLGLSSWSFHRQLRPLRLLTDSAQRIANGGLNVMISETDRDDEIGDLQNRFCKMKRSLQDEVSALEKATDRLHRRNDALRAALAKTEETDRMKTSFLHYMTNQMTVPTESIDRSVTTLCNNYHDIDREEVDKQVENIQQKSEAVLDLLTHMAHFIETESGKEAAHE